MEKDISVKKKQQDSELALSFIFMGILSLVILSSYLEKPRNVV